MAAKNEAVGSVGCGLTDLTSQRHGCMNETAGRILVECVVQTKLGAELNPLIATRIRDSRHGGKYWHLVAGPVDRLHLEAACHGVPVKRRIVLHYYFYVRCIRTIVRSMPPPLMLSSHGT